MSRVAEARPISSSVLEREPYVLSDPGDPATPSVEEGFRAILANRVRALDEFFAPTARVLQDLRHHLVAEACVAAVRKTGVQVQQGESVPNYLSRHPDLINPVLTLATEAQARSSAGDTWSLELYRDPEVESEYLTLQLRRQEYGENTLDIIDAVGAVAESLLVGASGWILVTTDFRSPRGG